MSSPARPAGALAAKRPRNLQVTAGLCALLILAWGLAAHFWAWSPKRGLGLGLGILAALLFVFEMAYPARRPRSRPLPRAMDWAQAHVYLGVVAFLAVVLHAGVAWPHGAMGWALLLLSAWTTATGLLGVMLQKWIPAALAQGLRVEALYERIPALADGLRAEADDLMEGATDTLDSFYRREIRPALSRLNPSLSFLADVRAGRERALAPIHRMEPYLGEDEKQKLHDLSGILQEKMELDAQHTLQGILRRWLVLHVPLAGLLMGLLIVHILAWAWY
jgi:hypothetical protein